MKRAVKAMSVRLFTLLYARLAGRESLSFSREQLRYAHLQFSQYGEDVFVYKWLASRGVRQGVFIDAGAFHPWYLSTTALLYSSGWSGINIDLNADKIDVFNRERDRDFNVKAALSSSSGRGFLSLEYEHTAFNSIVSVEDAEVPTAMRRDPIRKIFVSSVTLTEVLDRSPFKDKAVHYLNVDCEGHDADVIKGLDFERYRPLVVTVEANTNNERVVMDDLMNGLGYRALARLGVTQVYSDTR